MGTSEAPALFCLGMTQFSLLPPLPLPSHPLPHPPPPTIPFLLSLPVLLLHLHIVLIMVPHPRDLLPSHEALSLNGQLSNSLSECLAVLTSFLVTALLISVRRT